MDIETLMQYAFVDDDKMLQLQAALVGVLILGAEEARLMKICVRHPSHLYLCPPQLLPSPHFMTPWTQLYESYNDRAYITTMGFDVTTFHQLLDSGFADKWNSTPIPRADVSSRGEPRVRVTVVRALRQTQPLQKRLEGWREVGCLQQWDAPVHGYWDQEVMVQQDKGMDCTCGEMDTPNHDTWHGEDASVNGLDPRGSGNFHARCKLALGGKDQTIG